MLFYSLFLDNLYQSSWNYFSFPQRFYGPSIHEYTHTHTHTHAHTHATYTYSYTYFLTHIYTCTNMHTHSHTHTHTHDTCTHSYTYLLTHIYTHTNSHTHTLFLSLTHTLLLCSSLFSIALKLWSSMLYWSISSQCNVSIFIFLWPSLPDVEAVYSLACVAFILFPRIDCDALDRVQSCMVAIKLDNKPGAQCLGFFVYSYARKRTQRDACKPSTVAHTYNPREAGGLPWA